MPTVKVQKIVNAPIEEVWASWDDFGNIYKFNPSITASRLLSGDSTGIGARRECDLKDGKNWVREKIVDYVPLKRMEINIYESSMPIKTMSAFITFRAITNAKTEVAFAAEFEPKMGLLGKLMAPLMKRQFRPMLASMLDGNADYVEKGVLVSQAA